ncbi:MAG: methyltransferase domain-containing protein [Alphaproteobacteria bacterium]|nr:methyltransferase domain-containing protein [Alphaproteobacteria bacterium]
MNKIIKKGTQLKKSSVLEMEMGFQAAQKKNFKEALYWFEKALTKSSSDPTIYHNIAVTWVNLGNTEHALSYFFKALEKDLYNQDIAFMLCQTLQNFRGTLNYQVPPKILLHCFNLPNLDYQVFAPLALSLFKTRHPLTKILQSLNETTPDLAIQQLFTLHSRDILNDPLLNKFLRQTINLDQQFEVFLANIRKYILVHFESLQIHEPTLNHFIISLIQQCINNNYVFYIGAEETKLLDLYKDIVKKEKEINSSIIPFLLYEPLDPSFLEKDLSSSLPKITSNFIKDIVNAQKRENSLIQDTKVLSKPCNETSQIVASHYEENPYPRWLSILKPLSNHQTTFIARDRHSPLSILSKKQKPKILIAGCGTGKHVVQVAFQYPNSEITALDLSLKALAYAQQKAQEYKLSINFMQADLLNIHDLNEKFDAIESIGVLHHLKDPLVGWASLVSKLTDDGLMTIGLYRKLAQPFINQAQEKIIDLNLKPNSHDIRYFRNYIFNTDKDIMSNTHSWQNWVSSKRDFYNLDECRDFLFHQQEHYFDIPQLIDYFNQLNLEFGGFILSSHRFAMAHKLAGSKFNPGNLNDWWILEQQEPDIFNRMYIFWCKRKK